MVQHDMKEIQRKLELEVEQRQKAEAQMTSIEAQLQTEVSARQAALGNSQQSVEKVLQLEKQVIFVVGYQTETGVTDCTATTSWGL